MRLGGSAHGHALGSDINTRLLTEGTPVGEIALGKTRNEVEVLTREAFEALIADTRDEGRELPQRRNLAGYVAA